MPFFPQQKLTAGLHTSPGSAGPDHCVEALNVFASEGRVLKRRGCDPVYAHMVGDGDTFSVGLGTSSALRASASSGGVGFAGDAADTYFYIGTDTAPLYRAMVFGSIGSGITIQTDAIDPDTVLAQYWNGTAWTTIDRRFLPTDQTGIVAAGNNAFMQVPLVLMDPYSAATPFADLYILSLLMKPAADAAKTSLSGLNRYWVRLGPYPANALEGCYINPGADTLTLADKLHVKSELHWRDRSGAAHQLYVMHFDPGSPLFILDGRQLTVDDAYSVNNAVIMNEQTDIWCAYHEGSDQVLGRIKGIGWFSIKTARGDGTVQPFVLDSVGTDTPYANTVSGLLSGLPDGDAITIHDGRIWIADGEKVIWTAPGPYVDICPLDNFMQLTDGLGGCTAFASFSTALAIFKRKSIWTVQPDGVTSEGYTGAILPGNKGNVAKNSVCMFGDYCLFIGEDGAYIFDSGRITKVSGHVDDLWQDLRYAGNWERAKLTFNGKYNQARIFVPEPGNASMCGRALYVSLDGIVSDSIESGDDKVAPATWWPQGPYDGDYGSAYGFRAFSVSQDFTTDASETLLGDDHGIVWRLDYGFEDGTGAVKCKFRSSPVRVGNVESVILSRLVACFQNTGDLDWDLWFVVDENETYGRTQSQSAYLSAGQTMELVDASAVVDAVATVKAAPDYVTRHVPLAVRCSSFSVGAKHEAAGEMQWLSFQADANQVGNRSAR